jgi:phage gp46-like protein
MGYDIEYNAGTEGGPDNIMGDDNNYVQITGAASKVGRSVVAEWKDIDGEGFGNRAWKLLERELDTPTNRQLLAYHTEQALKWLVDNKWISNLVITVDDPAYLTGVAMLVSFTDTRSGDTSTLGFIAPWGHVDP